MVANSSKTPRVKIWLGSGLGLVAVMAALVTVGLTAHITQERILTQGEDSYQFHLPLFGAHRISQDVFVEHELNGISIILVNLRRATEIPNVIVTITDPSTDEQLDQVVISAHDIIDDAFVLARLNWPITPRAHKVIRLTFAAPRATAHNPIGIRFHPGNPYPYSSRLDDGQVEIGDLALQLHERVTLGNYVYSTVTHNSHFFRIVEILVAAIFVAVLSTRLGWQKRSTTFKHRLEIAILLTVALLAFAIRVAWLPSFHGVSGGDPYNYLVISQQLSNFDNPFAISKRLPGFPLILIPAYLTALDDIWWMRLISIVSAAVSVFLVAILARRLRLAWSVQIIAAILLTFHKDFWWTSLRPEPYTFYTMLLLAAMILFLNLRTIWHQLAFGFIIGYAAMTRQEGFVAAAFFGIAAIVFSKYVFNLPGQAGHWHFITHASSWRRLTRKLVTTFLPALVVVMPFFIHNSLRYGHPLYTEYFEGERLQIVDSVPAFFDSLGATWGVIGSMWRPRWDELYRVPLTNALFLIVAAATIVWWLISFTAFYRRSTTLRLSAIVGWLVLLGAGVWLASANKGLFNDATMVASAGILFVSFIPFIAATTWRGAIVICFTLSQILVALWFHPFAKHYQQAYPVLTLLLATALAPAVGRRFAEYRESQGSHIMVLLSRSSLILPLLLVAYFLNTSLGAFIDKYNHAVALDDVIYQAVQATRQLPGPYGSDQPYSQARVYFSHDIHYFFGDEPHTPQQALAWIKEHGVRTLIETNNNSAFENPPPSWQLVRSFRAEGKDERIFESRVYTIP